MRIVASGWLTATGTSAIAMKTDVKTRLKSSMPAMDGRLKLGWLRGLEPPTTGITIQDSNQLSYSHHCNARTWHDHPWNHFGRVLRVPVVATVMARPAGIEPATAGLEGRCSIRLSYGRPNRNLTMRCRNGRGRGIRTPDILLPKQARYQTALYPAGGTAPRPHTSILVVRHPRRAGHCRRCRGRLSTRNARARAPHA